MSSSSGASCGPIRRRNCRLAADSLAPEPHFPEPEYKMHRAIQRSIDTANFEHVQRMLDEGQTLCIGGHGFNCFILAVRYDADMAWPVLMEMLQVDPRGILVRDPDGKTLLNYYSRDVAKLKKLIELGVNLNNKDYSGKTAIQNLFSSEVLIYEHEILWKMFTEHEEIQNYVTKGGFFEELLQTGPHSLGRKMFCVFIRKGVMSVEELTAKLHMHPLFFIIQLDCQVSGELLHYIWTDDPDKKESVAAIGADLNILDRNGRTLLECLFDPDALKNYDLNRNSLTVEIWKLLIKRSEIKEQASSKDGFLRSLAPLAKKSSLVKDIFENIFQSRIWSLEKLTTELDMHPLGFLMKLVAHEGKPSEFLKVLKAYPHFLKDKTIIIDQQDDDYDDDLFSSWFKIKDVLDIAYTMTFDVFGYILFHVRSLDDEVEENRALFECLSTLLKYGFVPSSDAEVVHPVHALLYNFNRDFYGRSSEHKSILHYLLKTITFFNDFPFPHQLVLYPKTGSLVLDVHLMISVMLYSAEGRNTKANEALLFEFVMATMQLSPLHPLQNFAAIYTHSLRNFNKYLINRRVILEISRKLLRLCEEASGKHKFQEVDQQTYNCVNRFLKPVEEQVDEEIESDSEYEDEDEYKKISLPKRAAECEMGSLQWMCILQIRKTLFHSRSSTTVTLPSLIRGLVAEGHLPKGLEADLLVYKPSSCINF